MPLLPSRVWTAWRHAMQRVAVIASQATLGGTHRPLSLHQSTWAFCGCLHLYGYGTTICGCFLKGIEEEISSIDT